MAILADYLTQPPRYGIGAAATTYKPNLPEYIRITDINQYGQYRPDPRVSVDSPLSARFQLQNGDIVIARTGGSVGKSYRYRQEDGDLVFAGFLIAIRPDPKRLDPRYLEYTLQSKAYWDWVAAESIRSGQPGLNAQQLAHFEFDVPDIGLQRQVADNLGDSDRLITSLEHLISKKRAIRQGMMQELLTGRIRLPGFVDPWEQKSISQVLSPRTELNRSGETLEVLSCTKHAGFVRSLDYFKNQVYSRDLSNYRLIYRGDIGYPANHIEEGSIGVQELFDRALVSPIYVVMSPLGQNDSYFLQRQMKLETFRQRFSGLINASVDRRGSLRWKEFSRIKVMVPKPREQVAIARVLRDTESEITTLEHRLKKAQFVKHGMMLELLSGRTRLTQEAAP